MSSESEVIPAWKEHAEAGHDTKDAYRRLTNREFTWMDVDDLRRNRQGDTILTMTSGWVIRITMTGRDEIYAPGTYGLDRS